MLLRSSNLPLLNCQAKKKKCVFGTTEIRQMGYFYFFLFKEIRFI
jgi:hypothetical protein